MRIGLGIGVNSPSLREGIGEATPPYSFTNAEAEAHIARVSPEPDDTVKAAYDTFFGAVKVGATSGSNVLAKRDAIYVLSQPGGSLLNLCGATLDMSALGGITLADGIGYLGDGVDDNLSLGVAPGALTQFQQNSASAYISVNVDGGNIGAVVGQNANGTIRLQINPKTSGGKVSGRLNTATTFTTTASVANRTGSTELSRVNSTQTSIYRDGALVETLASTSATPASQTDPITILRSALATFVDDGVNGFAIGGGLTAAEVLDFDTAFQTLIAALEPP